VMTEQRCDVVVLLLGADVLSVRCEGPKMLGTFRLILSAQLIIAIFRLVYMGTN